MVIVWLCSALFGSAALVACGVTCRAVLRQDSRGYFFLTLSGSLGLVFFATIPRMPFEMIGIALVAVIAGVLMTSAPEPTVSFDSTATRKSRR